MSKLGLEEYKVAVSFARTALLSLILVHSFSDDISDSVTRVSDSLLSFATGMELDSISKTLYLEEILGTAPAPENFQTYLRKTSLVYAKYSGRDPATDFWGTPYRLIYQQGHAIVSSAGPDKVFGTADDLFGGWVRSTVIEPTRMIASEPVREIRHFDYGKLTKVQRAREVSRPVRSLPRRRSSHKIT